MVPMRHLWVHISWPMLHLSLPVCTSGHHTRSAVQLQSQGAPVRRSWVFPVSRILFHRWHSFISLWRDLAPQLSGFAYRWWESDWALAMKAWMNSQLSRELKRTHRRLCAPQFAWQGLASFAWVFGRQACRYIEILMKVASAIYVDWIWQ